MFSDFKWMIKEALKLFLYCIFYSEFHIELLLSSRICKPIKIHVQTETVLYEIKNMLTPPPTFQAEPLQI